MKNLLNIITLSICLLTISTNAANTRRLKYDSLSCLKIEGIVANANEGSDGACIIELISLDESVDTIVLKEGKRKFSFVLNKNSHYAIRVSKKGYISKLVSVNTEILTDSKYIHVFEFETSLVKEAAMARLNKDMLDFPVAIIHFDYEIESFSYNKEYTNYIKRELYKVSKVNNPSQKSTLAQLNPGVTASLPR